MPNRLAGMVSAHLGQHVGQEPDSLLFVNRHGRPIRVTVWAKVWDDARSETGLVDVRLDDLLAP